VLSVAKVTQAAAAGYADYLEGKAQAAELGDYYLKDGERVEAPGRWAAGAGAVGAHPALPVTGEQLISLMAVRRPDNGQPLRRHGGSGEAVAALDATFSAPKSVSAAWAIADPQLRARIEQAHEYAIDQALTYSSKHVAMVRKRVDPKTVIHEKPAGLIATSWRHTTARAVVDQLPDPQLHSHVLLHGAVRRDGRIVAIDSRSWLVHRRELGAAYRSELAGELNQLGFGIQRGTGRGRRYFEITGIPAAVIDRWSSRHHQVREAIHQRLAEQQKALRELIAAGGPESRDAAERLELLRRTGLAPREERFMSTATRSAKARLTHADLDEYWRATASRHQFDRPTLERLSSPKGPLATVRGSELLDGLAEFDATFPARDARAVALERSAGAPIEEILRALSELRAGDEILLLADGTGTTRAHRRRELATVHLAQRIAVERIPPIPSALVTRETDRLDHDLVEQGGRLSTEQRQAIELACGAQRFVVIEGHAGTGKSTTLSGIARAHQAAGRQILITSTAAIAAERLARELTTAAVEASAYSTAALHSAITTGQIQLGPETTIIHDEAALASTREQQRLLAEVDESGARLIAVGDPAQNHPVGAGGLWYHLETVATRAGAQVELTHNQRARDPADRRDQSLFREGQHEQAIRGYAARGRVHITDNQRQAEDVALDAAHADRTAGKTTIVVAQTSNEHLDELNARAQAIRHQHDELGCETLPLPGRPYALYPSDEIQIRRTIPHPEHGRLRNGTTAQIADIDPGGSTASLQLADGRKVTLDAEQAAQADLRLAYVQHPFPAQGQTTDTAHLIIAEHATQEGSYVALTRAREQTHIHAESPADQLAGDDRLQVLSERISRTEPELPSINTPLVHESAITANLARTSIDESDGVRPQSTADRTAMSAFTRSESAIRGPATSEAWTHVRGRTQPEQAPEPELERARRAPHKVPAEQNRPLWPRSQHHDRASQQLRDDQATHLRGWEP
jgi:conjugative relaxase-like TrwC/TraI family protein